MHATGAKRLLHSIRQIEEDEKYSLRMKSHKPAARHPTDKLCSGRPDLQIRELLPSCHRIDVPLEWGDCPAYFQVGTAAPYNHTTRREH